MTFWAQLATAERERLDAWHDVEPALCSLCHTVRRTALLGVCAACLETWESDHGR